KQLYLKMNKLFVLRIAGDKMTQSLFNVGKIINTHGLKGEVKVYRITDFDDRFQIGNTLYVLPPDKKAPIKVTVKSHHIHKGYDLHTFDEFNNINEIEKYKNMYLAIEEAQLSTLDDEEYYYHEIIGCSVYLTTNGNKLGTVKEILSPGANDVWVVDREKEKDVLIPYIKDVVKEVNRSEKTILIEPMDGLLE